MVTVYTAVVNDGRYEQAAKDMSSHTFAHYKAIFSQKKVAVKRLNLIMRTCVVEQKTREYLLKDS